MDDGGPRLDSLLSGLGPDASPAGVLLVRDAFGSAAQLHAGQIRRDGALVFDHVLGAAANAVAAGEGDPEVIAAALLHDVVEKTHTTAADLGERFGPRVAHLVDVLTKRPAEDSETAVRRALEAGREALLLRLCDRLDGLRRSAGRDPGSREHFIATARQVHLPVAEEHFPSLAAAFRTVLDQLGGLHG